MTLIRKALYAKVIFTAICSLVAIVGASTIGEAFGVEAPIMVLVGAALLTWAALVAIFARRQETRRTEAWVVIAGDELWVIGVIVLLALFPDALTDTGKLWLAILTLVVATLASIQLLGLKQLRSNPEMSR
jgi:threonine/homoserine/homoserine lactone efflux protein